MSAAPLTILVTAVGSPGTVALLRALRENGERAVRLIGTDMRAEAVGAFHCDAFSTVPAGSDPAFGQAVLEIAKREGVDVVLPQASFDLERLAEHAEAFAAAGITLICSTPDVVRAADSKHETLALCERLGVRAPAFRLARGGAEVAAAARELGYPDRDVCMKPVIASGSRGFHVISANVDERRQLLEERPGAMPLRLGDVERILGDDTTELLVMELVEGIERTVDGYAEHGQIVIGHPKTREAMRAGLAMRFETLEAPELMTVAEQLVRGFGLHGFFNLQLIGDAVLEMNPRISTIVYQDDLNLAWLGIRRAIGELTDAEAAAAQANVRPGRIALRYFDQLEYDPS
jgi:carbamoyl-phosphate synthase large subunit